MKNRLMILGSLEEFVQLVQIAKERNIYTIVCDGNHNSPAKQAADKSYDIDVTDIERIADVCKAEEVDGIITSFSDLLFECMVKIADKAQIKCYLTPDKLCYYRDKTAMKRMFFELGIQTPKYTCLKKGFSDSELDGISFPVVIKPIDKYGSRGIYVLNSPDEIRQKFDGSCASSDIKQILVEEYHDGHEFNMMTWVLDGIVHVISIADREKTPIHPQSIPISTRNVYPSRLYDEVAQEAEEILQKVVNYTGQTSGALSMQFFWHPGKGVSVCEIAGRFLGYEHELIEYSSGFSTEKLLLDYVYDEAALRHSLAAHNPRMNRCSAVLYFHGKEHAEIADMSSLYQIADRDDVVYSQIFYHAGETITPFEKPYAARYYITGDDRAAVDSITDEVFHQITIKDPNGDEVLYQNKMGTYDA